MHCPHCELDLNDDVPECPGCSFHIRDLDEAFGEPPVRPDPVSDEAGFLAAEAVEPIRSRIEEIRTRTGAEVLVATEATSAPRKPSERVFWLFNRWEVGGASHRGVLILAAREERRLEVEVGIGLEHIFTDEACARILETHAVPFFKMERYEDGLRYAVDVIGRVLEHAGLEDETA